MWSPEADYLHLALIADLQRGDWHDGLQRGDWHDGLLTVPEVLTLAGDSVRFGLGDKDALTEAQFCFAVWLDRFAPGKGLRGLVVMLGQRAAARGWQAG
jgi:hypothetical protein